MRALHWTGGGSLGMRRLSLELLERRILLNGGSTLTGNIDLDTGSGTGPDGVIRVFGDDAGDYSGAAVASVGDVDDDGYDDLVVGAYQAGRSGKAFAGEAYLVLGRDGADWADVDLDAGTLPDGVFRVWGDDAGDRLGVSVAAAGDVNDDGYDDFVIGAYTANTSGGDGSGESYIVLGRATGDWDDIDLDGSPAGVVRISGDDAGDYSGISVAGAGDVNGDDYDDVLIGAYAAGDSAQGEAYLVFGRATGDWDDIDLDDSPADVIRILGDDAGDYCGWCVAGAGDVDDDGFDDLLIGAFGADASGRPDAGETYLVFGRSPALWGDIDLDGSPAGVIRISGNDSSDRSGTRVAPAGDVNGDGYSDFLIGARFASHSGIDEAGEAYVVLGRDRGDWSDIDLGLAATGVFRIYGDDEQDHCGVSLAPAGDANGDGYGDFLVGAYDADPAGGDAAGEAYLILGRSTGDWTNLNLNTDLGPAGVIRIFGDDAGDACGVSVSGGGDLDGDGYDDFLVGARSADPSGGDEAGEAYLIFGGSTPEIRPDLSVSDVAYGPGIYASGTPLPASMTLSNLGGATAQPTFYVDVYLSSDTVLGNADDVLISRYEDDQGLAPYTTRSLVRDGQIPESTPWGAYYLVVVADPLDQVFEGDETNNEWWSDTADVLIEGDYVPVAQIRSGGVLVSIYDVNGGASVDPDDIAVKFGKGDSISSVKLTGYGSMDGLGIVISGADSVGSIRDSRKGVKGELAFIASDAPIKSIKLKSGMTGYNLNDLTLSGIAFDEDIDGDEDDTDATAIYSEGAVGSLKADQAVTGDVWIGGQDDKGVSLKSFSTKYGGFHGDLVTVGDVTKISLGGDFGSSMHVGGDLKSLTIKGGDLEGEVHVAGTVGKINVSRSKSKLTGLHAGGSVTADASIVVEGHDSKGRSLKSLSVTGGDFAGLLDAAGEVSSFQVKGTKGVGGDLEAGAHIGTRGRLKKLSVGGSMLGGPDDDLIQIYASAMGNLSVKGDVQHSRILAGAHLGDDWALGGVGDAADAFLAGNIDKFSVKGNVADSLIGAGLKSLSLEDRPFYADSRIKSVSIKGTLSSSADVGMPFGLGAYEIGKVKVGRDKQHSLIVSEV